MADLKVRWTKTCIDLTDMKFGRLTVRELAGRGHQRILLWRCDCECGRSTIVPTADLKASTRSCGCLVGDTNRAKKTIHGLGHTREYRIWGLMIERCSNPNNVGWATYGGKGVRVCDRWLNSVEAFYADMGPRPTPKHSIDRIDSGGNYEPGNCRWADNFEQANNTSRNRFLTHGDLTLTFSQWDRRLGLCRGTVGRRIRLGWPTVDALTVPKGTKLLRSRRK